MRKFCSLGKARANFIIRDVDKEQSMRSQEFTLHIGEKLDKEEAIPTDSTVPIAQQVKKNTEAITNLKESLEEMLQGGGGTGTGSIVVVNPILTSGTKVAEITVNGSKKTLYAPTGDDAHINDLIDAKLTPLETLSAQILGVL